MKHGNSHKKMAEHKHKEGMRLLKEAHGHMKHHHKEMKHGSHHKSHHKKK